MSAPSPSPGFGSLLRLVLLGIAVLALVIQLVGREEAAGVLEDHQLRLQVLHGCGEGLLGGQGQTHKGNQPCLASPSILTYCAHNQVAEVMV